MSFFDVPNNNYGTYFNPVMVFAYVEHDDLKYLKARCNELEINFERWFFSGKAGVIEKEEMHESLKAGVIVYYPQYNCIRNGDHIENAYTETVPFNEFAKRLRRHPKHLGSFFIKTQDVGYREVILTWFRTRGYNLSTSIPMFDFETAVLINEPLKMLITHSNKRADENEAEGYPVMTYEDFKIYMQ